MKSVHDDGPHTIDLAAVEQAFFGESYSQVLPIQVPGPKRTTVATGEAIQDKSLGSEVLPASAATQFGTQRPDLRLHLLPRH